ncbi:hypothetical protein GOBAR_AA11782 [Gossypium barbadense]|uniref:Uncharacterized protein n=1 Tax=Gossypium barbadense TaxID=3634 RepID=A0A2P5XZU5_GOSBA|nr:hypothetical protein GOBAR_AA11782 [Gossypium barbadense]
MRPDTASILELYRVWSEFYQTCPRRRNLGHVPCLALHVCSWNALSSEFYTSLLLLPVACLAVAFRLRCTEARMRLVCCDILAGVLVIAPVSPNYQHELRQASSSMYCLSRLCATHSGKSVVKPGRAPGETLRPRLALTLSPSDRVLLYHEAPWPRFKKKARPQKMGASIEYERRPNSNRGSAFRADSHSLECEYEYRDMCNITVIVRYRFELRPDVEEGCCCLVAGSSVPLESTTPRPHLSCRASDSARTCDRSSLSIAFCRFSSAPSLPDLLFVLLCCSFIIGEIPVASFVLFLGMWADLCLVLPLVRRCN